MHAWNHNSARVAGFGWWKPVLCRKHLSSLPSDDGLLVFSDAGNAFQQSSTDSWKQVFDVMHHFDILAIVDDFVERYYTKRRVLQLFAGSLAGTDAFNEGQFASRMFILRKTPVAMNLLRIWEDLVSDV